MPLPATLAIAFGALTCQGHGGHDLGYTGVGPLTISGAPAVGRFAIDNSTNAGLVTEGGRHLTIGATSGYTYGAAPLAEFAALSVATAYTFTVNSPDEGSCEVAVTVRPHEVFWRPHGRDTTGTNGTQYARAFYQIPANLVRVPGWAIVQRNGTIFNGEYLTSGKGLRGAGSKQDAPAFNPANPVWIDVRPETDYGATIGRLTVQGDCSTAGIGVGKFVGFRWTRNIFAWQPALGTDFLSGYMLQFTLGVQHCAAVLNRFEGQPASPYGDELRGGATCDATCRSMTIESNLFQDVAFGITLQTPGQRQDPVTRANIATGQADINDASGAHRIRLNTINRFGLDAINLPSGSGDLVELNIIVGRSASLYVLSGGEAVIAAQPPAAVGQRLSPYNVGSPGQPHGDFLQGSYSSCHFGRVAGIIVRNNTFMRGAGRDSMPFWSATASLLNATASFPAGLAYPNPNYTNASSSIIPDPTFAMLDGQGIFIEDNDPGKARGGGLFYTVVIDSPVIEGNFCLITLTAGIYLRYCENPVVRFNTVLGDRLPPSVGNAATMLVGSGVGINMAFISGTAGVVQGNIAETFVVSLSAGATLDYGAGPVATGTTNAAPGSNHRIPLDWATKPVTFAALFEAPLFSSAMTGQSVARMAYRPKAGTAIEDYGFVDGAGVFRVAGAVAPPPPLLVLSRAGRRRFERARAWQ